jgi:carboxymethylenebutenolidase
MAGRREPDEPHRQIESRGGSLQSIPVSRQPGDLDPETIEIEADDGHRLTACIATPTGEPRGAIVVIQTAFGVDDYLRDVCRSYAGDGYVSIAPALYDRQRRDAVFELTPEGGAQAQKFRGGFVWSDVLRDVEAARRHVAGFGRVGVVGFCVGGSVAWLASQTSGFAAASCYYGKDIVDHLGVAPKCPTMLHFGERDHLIAIGDVDEIRLAFPAIPTFVYPAGHGFDATDPQCATVARGRSLELFRANIG